MLVVEPSPPEHQGLDHALGMQDLGVVREECHQSDRQNIGELQRGAPRRREGLGAEASGSCPSVFNHSAALRDCSQLARQTTQSVFAYK